MKQSARFYSTLTLKSLRSSIFMRTTNFTLYAFLDKTFNSTATYRLVIFFVV